MYSFISLLSLMGMKNKLFNLLSSGRNQAYKLDLTVSKDCVIKVKRCSDFKYSSHISFFPIISMVCQRYNKYLWHTIFQIFKMRVKNCIWNPNISCTSKTTTAGWCNRCCHLVTMLARTYHTSSRKAGERGCEMFQNIWLLVYMNVSLQKCSRRVLVEGREWRQDKKLIQEKKARMPCRREKKKLLRR